MRQFRKKNKQLGEDEIWRIAYEIALGMEYLHEQQIEHRDLKNLNVFLTKEKSVK